MHSSPHSWLSQHSCTTLCAAEQCLERSPELTTETIIRVLSISALSGLLLGVGLRLTLTQMIDSLRGCRLALIVLVNFALVPTLTVAAARAFGLAPELAIGMLLLGAAPFAPVVPVLSRMARADLPLAAGLTALFPLLCAVLTPLVCALGLQALPSAGELRFNTGTILLTLLGTVTLPLALGLAVNRHWPRVRVRVLRGVEIVAEATGALSLAFATFAQLPNILATGWRGLLVMLLVNELSLRLGWFAGGPARSARQVVGLGTSNRNIALALLLAIQTFPGTPVAAAVVANGLLMILLGLLRVAYWHSVQARLGAVT
ncbi:MAG: bile acid transporter [Gammaproteobacteria bacterium]|nr:bile acid transporter [Gammaproteobacteria bacterium]